VTFSDYGEYATFSVLRKIMYTAECLVKVRYFPWCIRVKCWTKSISNVFPKHNKCCV